MGYAAMLEPADDGSISVWVPDLPGCVSRGDTREEALAAIAEAIGGHIETLRESGMPVPPAGSSATVIAA